MFILGHGEDENVIKVDKHTGIEQVSDKVINQCLENNWGMGTVDTAEEMAVEVAGIHGHD